MWIEEAEWNRTQQIVPIVCVDAIVVKRGEDGSLSHIGLILRETPHEGRKWCTVGGRLIYGETIDQGLCRQIVDALGTEVDIHPISTNEMPIYIAQYYPGLCQNDGFDGIDPRKHAIGLTYCVEISSEIRPGNEALDFKWFTFEEIRGGVDIGFNQTNMILTCCERLENYLETQRQQFRRRL